MSKTIRSNIHQFWDDNEIHIIIWDYVKTNSRCVNFKTDPEGVRTEFTMLSTLPVGALVKIFPTAEVIVSNS